MLTKKKVILALDGMTLKRAEYLCRLLAHKIYGVKIHDLWDIEGPAAVNAIKEACVQHLWIDLKLHDIPATVAKRAEALHRHGADMISVHAAGGLEMMGAARASGADIIAVTVLTSLTTGDVMNTFGSTPEDAVMHLAHQACLAGCYGIVCSPQEVAVLANNERFSMTRLITPGVRSRGAELNDQVRVGTPAQAVSDGADFLVIGRQVTEAHDPEAALHLIEDELLEIESE